MVDGLKSENAPGQCEELMTQKTGSPPRTKTPSVGAAHLAAAIAAVKAMDLRQKEQVCDRITPSSRTSGFGSGAAAARGLDADHRRSP